MTAVSLSVNGEAVTVPAGSRLLRAVEAAGQSVPHLCDHPLLEPAGVCRECLVEVAGEDKPVAACTTVARAGMAVHTRVRPGVLQLSIVDGSPIALSSAVLLDEARCVSCTRCTRFIDQIAGDPVLAPVERAEATRVGVGPAPLDSYFSGDAVEICPTGALSEVGHRPPTSHVEPTVCEHCAAGCALTTELRRGTVSGRAAAPDQEWACDKGRAAFRYTTAADRLTYPRMRNADGRLTAVSWPYALRFAAAGLAAATGAAGVLTGGRLTVEDAYAYARFARVVLRTNDIDFRARPVSEEETAFLTALAGRPAATYADVAAAPSVLLAGLEPEEESPVLFLRLRAAARAGTAVFALAPFATRGLDKLYGTLVPTAPGAEPASLDEADDLLAPRGSVLLVGERLADAPGGLTAAWHLASRTGATLGWVPRRAGDRGALAAGAFPTLLPGARPVDDPVARAEVALAWGVPSLPASPGRDTTGILAADLKALLIGGVDLADLPDPLAARAAVERAPFVVSLEQRPSTVSELADVVFPVAAVTEKSGSFRNWENRSRGFVAALSNPDVRPDLAVLAEIARCLGSPMPHTAREAQAELAALGTWPARPYAPPTPSPSPTEGPPSRAGEAILATWSALLDDGRLQAGAHHLTGTARQPVVRLSASTASDIGAQDGSLVTVSTSRGGITLPLTVTAMPDRVVWVPRNSPGSHVHADLAAQVGDVVRIAICRP